MSRDVVYQGRLFAMAVLWGGTLMLAYDCLRLFRIFVRQRQWLMIVEEVIFWLLMSGWLYALLYRYNDGAVRNYIVFGIGTGMGLYRWLLSAVFISKMSWVMRFILRPVQRMCHFFKSFVKNIENTLQSVVRKGTIKCKKLRRRKWEEHDGSE